MFGRRRRQEQVFAVVGRKMDEEEEASWRWQDAEGDPSQRRGTGAGAFLTLKRSEVQILQRPPSRLTRPARSGGGPGTGWLAELGNYDP
jgi:hypothetical protein